MMLEPTMHSYGRVGKLFDQVKLGVVHNKGKQFYTVTCPAAIAYFSSVIHTDLESTVHIPLPQQEFNSPIAHCTYLNRPRSLTDQSYSSFVQLQPCRRVRRAGQTKQMSQSHQTLFPPCEGGVWGRDYHVHTQLVKLIQDKITKEL